jgi:hypothetical protein
MSADVPFFQIPLNLPHAGRVALRITSMLDREGKPTVAVEQLADRLVALLHPYAESDENPRPAVATRVRDQAAELGRKLVDEIESAKLGHDRLGQCVRNLFECLELGREGATISLRAGENPGSFQRPA